VGELAIRLALEGIPVAPEAPFVLFATNRPPSFAAHAQGASVIEGGTELDTWTRGMAPCEMLCGSIRRGKWV